MRVMWVQHLQKEGRDVDAGICATEIEGAEDILVAAVRRGSSSSSSILRWLLGVKRVEVCGRREELG